MSSTTPSSSSLPSSKLSPPLSHPTTTRTRASDVFRPKERLPLDPFSNASSPWSISIHPTNTLSLAPRVILVLGCTHNSYPAGFDTDFDSRPYSFRLGPTLYFSDSLIFTFSNSPRNSLPAPIQIPQKPRPFHPHPPSIHTSRYYPVRFSPPRAHPRTGRTSRSIMANNRNPSPH